MKISPDEAFLTLHRWQVERTPIVLVGSLMPTVLLRGLVNVVTREGIWTASDRPASIWGFSLREKEANFLASAFEGFECLQSIELPSEIRISLPTELDRPVLALTRVMKLPRLPRAEGDAPACVPETLFLVENAVVP
jgi:hypothetical protein